MGGGDVGCGSNRIDDPSFGVGLRAYVDLRSEDGRMASHKKETKTFVQ
jgi:hypothetical protein